MNKDEELVWHGQQEKILKRWSEIGSSYRFMHDRAFIHYEKQNFRFALPVIVISTVTGTANFAQGAFPVSWQSYVPLFAGFLNLSAGLITTIAQFLRVYELLEGSRAQVWHGTAYKTSGGLTKAHLFMNKHGRVVSRKKHNTAKKEKRLQKHGYFTRKGKFGAVKKSAKHGKTGKKKSRRRRR